jgi:hypothetical protein
VEETHEASIDGVTVPLVRMEKALR